MLFKEFVLHNFGIYKGRHSVDLMPEAGRPIILFGALNGSGKTTFLDGLQLVLYGKHARCTGRGNMSYPDFLRSAINRYVSPQEGAGLELEFIHHREGKWQTIRVSRTWNGRSDTTHEKLQVTRNGVFDAVLSERWGEFVEDFIPSQISELFFFDGEKIEALAEDQSAAAIIRTGIHALLGLDVVDRLLTDIKIVQRRRRTEELAPQAKAALQKKEDVRQTLRDQADDLKAHGQVQQDTVKRLAVEMKLTEDTYRQQGGELAEQANLIEAQLQHAREQAEVHNQQLRDRLAAGQAPLLLVRNLLTAARSQLAAESNAHLSVTMLREIEARDQKVIDLLTRNEVGTKVRAAVSAHLASDREVRAASARMPTYLRMRADALSTFGEAQSAEVKADLAVELEREQVLSERVNDLERTLAAMPNPEALAPLRERLNGQRQLHQQALGAMALLDRQHEELLMAEAQADRELRSMRLELAGHDLKKKTNERVLRHAQSVENTLRGYREAILHRNVERLSSLILDSFQTVTRKPKMVARIDISPKDYRLALFDHDGNQIPTHQLSAGERQLLAVSILWGLSRASGRSLPAIIDTPLGRLDGHHRHKLVKNYFPKASNQVILLSTDREIDAELHVKLRRVMTHEYLIEYSEKQQSSEIHPGYFTFNEAYT